MAGSTDLRDIMGLPSAEEAAIASAGGVAEAKAKELLEGGLKPASKSVAVRPKGMSREVFNLGSFGLPPVIPSSTAAEGGYKQTKARLGNRRAVPWTWQPFENPARTDGLKLCHWRKRSEQDDPPVYPFAKFNKSVETVSYTDDEYRAHLTSEQWTQRETDLLVSLARQYDLRFIPIADRYAVIADEWGVSPRCIEELKERYYAVAETLVVARGASDDEDDTKKRNKGNPASRKYDVAHEQARKTQLEALLERSQEELAVEADLTDKLKKIEARRKDRDQAKMQAQSLRTGTVHAPRKCGRPRKVVADGDDAGKKKSKTQAKERICGVSARSDRLVSYVLAPRLTRGVDQLLDSLGCLVQLLPTEAVCNEFDGLRDDIIELLELQRHVEQRKEERRVVLYRLEASRRAALGEDIREMDPTEKKKGGTSSETGGTSGGFGSGEQANEGGTGGGKEEDEEVGEGEGKRKRARMDMDVE